MVDEDSSFIPGHDSRGLGLDHFRMSKFTGPEDGDYHAVRDEILKLDGKLKAQDSWPSLVTDKSFRNYSPPETA